jgi:hypothetical protein
VQLKGGVGAEGDAYEQHADRVADLVVSGASAEGELDRMAGGGSGGGAAVQRLPFDTDGGAGSTAKMHADIYGDSSLAHGTGPDNYDYTVDYLTQGKFDWTRYRGGQPTVAILQEWLTFFHFHEPRPLDFDAPDRVDFNGSTAYFTANVASIFTADARAAGLTYDWGMAKAQIERVLAPMVAARKKVENDINTGKAPGPGDVGQPGAPGAAKDQDDSTQTTIQWLFVPTTVHKGGGQTTVDSPVEQVTGQWTQQFHKDGKAGGELNAAAQVTLTADRTKQQVHVQNVAAVVGGQWVIPFLDDFIELQPVVQLLLGATLQPGTPGVGGQMSASRIIAGASAMGGANVIFNIPGTNKKIQVVLQGQAGVSSSGGNTTFDKTAGVGVQFVL